MAAKEEAAKKEAAPRESLSTALSGMQNQRVLWTDPEIAGYLEKRGGRFTSWKRRYFILQGYFLYYFISEQQTETPLGLIPIEGCTIKESADVGGKLRRHVFYLNIGALHIGYSKTETYVLAASSREMLEEWTEKLVLAAENREELFGDLRCARALVGEIRGLLALSPSEKRLFAALHNEEARVLQLELKRANTEISELKKEIESVSIEADRQESALLQQLVLWDIMSLTDHGESNDDYPTLTRLQDEVRYSDEIYRLLYKKGSLFQGEGLQDLKRECRSLLVSLVRQVLDLIEEHHAKIRAKAPRFSFNVDPIIYEDMFYVKASIPDDEQAALEMLAQASKSDDDSDEERETEEEFHRRFTVLQPRGSVDNRRPSALAIPQQPARKSAAASPKQAPASPKQSQAVARPKLFPEQQRPYQLTRSASRGWQVTPAGGGSPVTLAPVLRKRTHFYENPNMIGSVASRTISEVTEEDDPAAAAAAAASDRAADSSVESMRRRVGKVHPIFISHFGPETRPPASHIKHDPNSTQPVPTSAPELPFGVQPPFSRPNVLAYVKGTIPRAKSVRPLKPSEIAALAAAAAAGAGAGTSSAAKQRPSSATPPRSRPSTADVASSSRAAASAPGTPAATPRKSERRSIVLQAAEVSPTTPAEVRARSSLRLGPGEDIQKAAAAAAAAGSTAAGAAAKAAPPTRTSPTRSRATVKFADQNVVTITAPGMPGRASFIGIDPELLEAGPSYGRIRDFPVLVPSILNSDVGLAFPENAGSGSGRRQRRRELSSSPIKQPIRCRMGSRSVAAILAEIKQCRTLETGKRLFTEAIAAGLYQSSSSATLLLGLYSRCGSIDDAVYIFDRLPCHSAVAWTCLIAGYTENGRPDLALELFSSSVRAPRSWEPSSRTIVAALSACSALLLASDRSKLAKMECRDRARWIHSRARENGLGDDVFVANALVDLYAKCGSLIESRGVFDRMRDRCVVSWTSLILGFAENGDGEFALELYSRVLLEGLAIDDRMLVAVYTACGSLAAIEDGRIKLRSLRRTMAIESLAGELGGDVFVGNALMDAYRKCGSLLDAARVFDTVEQRDVVSWTTRILGFVDAGEMELGLESFDAMKMECVPNSRAYVAALKACSGLGSLHKNNEQSRSRYLEKGRQIHVEVSSRGLEIDLYVATSLISMYASCGCVDRARSIFDAIAAKSSVCWNVMLAGYVENGDHIEALELLEAMRIRPTARTFVAALEACAATTNSGAGSKLHGEICRAGMETDRCVATSLVDLYGKCGSVVKARQAFDSMSSTTIDTAAWSSLISGYGRLGDASNALDLVEAMEREGIEPDGAVILEVLTACSHAGLVDRGRGFFSRAKKSSYGHRIGIDHYNSVVDMLGRANRLEEAFAMARTMPVAANAMTWRALLAASRKWSNAEMGEEAFGLLMELGETEASSYVIMANIQSDRRGEGGELL